MFAMRRWLRSKAAKAFVIALLGVQVTPLVQACPMPMVDVSTAYATAEMPDVCAGLAKHINFLPCSALSVGCSSLC